MTHFPTYEEACAAKHAGAEQPQMAAGQYWYNQFGVLWYIHLETPDSFWVYKIREGQDVEIKWVYKVREGQDVEIKMKDFDSVIYAATE